MYTSESKRKRDAKQKCVFGTFGELLLFVSNSGRPCGASLPLFHPPFGSHMVHQPSFRCTRNTELHGRTPAGGMTLADLGLDQKKLSFQAKKKNVGVGSGVGNRDAGEVGGA